MASPNSWPAAFALLGPDITAQAGNYLSGSVYWVDSTSSVASDANAGTEPELPKATWLSAYTASTAGDMILCQPGHAETIAAAQTLAKTDILTIGLGTGTQRPRFTSNVAGVMFTVTGARTGFYNCYFPASTAATTARIADTTGTELYLNGCYFECGVNDTTNCVTIAANDAQILNTQFAATASRPARAVNLSGATSGFIMQSCVFDGSSYGWTSRAFDVTTGAQTGMLIRDVQLMNRSDFYVSVTGATYKMFGVRSVDNTGTRIVIAA